MSDTNYCVPRLYAYRAFHISFAQLEEEAHLSGGTWHALCDDADTTINADKYSNNEFYCWLVVDPHVTLTPRALDDEESIEIKRGLTMKQVSSMLTGGKLSMVSSFVFLMGTRKLRELGLLEE